MAEALLASLNAKKVNGLPAPLNTFVNDFPKFAKHAADDIFAESAREVQRPAPPPPFQPPPQINPPHDFSNPSIEKNYVHVQKPQQQVRFKTRPTSIGNALDVFGESGVDTLLGLMHDVNGYETEVSDAASKAGFIRRLLAILIFIVSSAACSISASPICAVGSVVCQSNIAMTTAILNAVIVVLLFLHEKNQARNQAPRLRDLSSDFANLGGSVRSAIYSAPPAAESSAAFLRSVTARHEELKTRALAYGVKRHRTQPV